MTESKTLVTKEMDIKINEYFQNKYDKDFKNTYNSKYMLSDFDYKVYTIRNIQKIHILSSHIKNNGKKNNMIPTSIGFKRFLSQVVYTASIVDNYLLVLMVTVV